MEELWKPMLGFEEQLLVSNKGVIKYIKNNKLIHPNKKGIFRIYVNKKQHNISAYTILFSNFNIKFDKMLDHVVNIGEYNLNKIVIHYFDYTKTCNTCMRVKSLDYYHNRNRGRYGKSERCIFCASKEGSDYYKNNKAKVNEKNIRNRKKNNKYYKAKDKNRRNFLARKRTKLNRFKENERLSRRKALERRCRHLFKSDKENVLQFYKKAEFLTKTTGVEYQVDHIIPLKHPLVCGLHVSWNLQILTKYENCKKGNKLL